MNGIWKSTIAFPFMLLVIERQRLQYFLKFLTGTSLLQCLKNKSSKTQICWFIFLHISLKGYDRHHRLDEFRRSGLLDDFRWASDASCWLPLLLRGDSVSEADSEASFMRAIYKNADNDCYNSFRCGRVCILFCVNENDVLTSPDVSAQLSFSCLLFTLPSCCQLTARLCNFWQPGCLSLSISLLWDRVSGGGAFALFLQWVMNKAPRDLRVWQRGVPQSAFVCPSSHPSSALRSHTVPPLASPGTGRPKYSSRTEERGVSLPLQHLQLIVIDKLCTGLSISLQHQGIEWLRKTVI